MADWVAIKTEYITGTISQRDLAAVHGVPYQTLKDHSRKEGWYAERLEFQRNLKAETLRKSAEKISDAESSIAAYKAQCREKGWMILAGTDLDKLDGQDKRRWFQNYSDMLNHETEEADDDTLKKARELLGGVDSAI